MDNRKGFTLVELSIVLVIVGLLIGGILAAQSMIGTTKIQALVRQVGQFDAALANFQTKYQQLPGDNNLMGSVKGNNDGAIRYDSFPQDAWQGEAAKYWSDLSISGLTNSTGGAYQDESSPSAILDTDIAKKLPQAVAGTKAYFIVFGSPGINWYIIGQLYARGGAANSEIGINMAFTPADTLAIDQKMDDGQPGTGNMTGNDRYDIPYRLSNSTAPYRGTGTHCTTGIDGGALIGQTYQTSYTTNECFLLIRLGSSISNPQ